MKKKKHRLLVAGWLFLVMLSRFLYFFMVQETMADTYAYYANAMVNTDLQEPVLTSGLAYAYTELLRDLVQLLGSSVTMIVIFQMILQILWLTLFFNGVRLLWGTPAGCLSGIILLLAPDILQTMMVAEPANFFMLHWSILFFLFAICKSRTEKKGWYRNNAGELFLILTGFYMGVVCTWNYIGFLLLVVMGYVLTRNREALSEGIFKQKNLELKEKEQLMPVTSQGMILLMGMLVGMFATLMKYTGLTGWVIMEQFFWWQDQLKALPGRCQEISPIVTVWILFALFAGIISGICYRFFKQKAEERREYKELMKELASVQRKTQDDMGRR